MVNNKKLCIVFLHHPEPPYSGGSFHCVEQLSKYLILNNEEFYVVDKEGSNLKIKDCESACYKIPKIIKNTTKYFFVIGRLLEFIYVTFALIQIFIKKNRQKKIDTIYVPIAELLPTTFSAGIIKMFYKVKVVTVVHQWEGTGSLGFTGYLKKIKSSGTSFINALAETVFISFFQFFFARTLCSFDKVATVSNFTKEHLQKSLNLRIPIKVLNYGCIDHELFDTVPNQEKKFDAVFLGRLTHSKGLKDMVDIWSGVKAYIPDAKLLIIGDGEKSFVNSVKKYAEEKNVGNNIIFVGQVIGEEKVILLKSSKVFLFLSHIESYGQVINEAIKSGLPIVAYNLPVYQDRFDYTKHLYLFSKKESYLISKKVVSIINNYHLIPKNIGVNAGFPSWESLAIEEYNFISK